MNIEKVNPPKVVKKERGQYVELAKALQGTTDWLRVELRDLPGDTRTQKQVNLLNYFRFKQKVQTTTTETHLYVRQKPTDPPEDVPAGDYPRPEITDLLEDCTGCLNESRVYVQTGNCIQCGQRNLRNLI
jgi:hypothetical protein